MSTYEDYKKTSSFFDKTRSALGIDIIVKELKRSTKPLNQQVVVDAGCGTGLYSEALINEVKSIDAVDINYEMLDKAKNRLKAKNKKNIRFHLTTIDSLKFDNQFADAIIVNQVLHHLPENAEMCWDNHSKVFREFFRILKPEGCLIINSCSPEQLNNGFWFYHLIPNALNKILEKTIDLKTLSKILKKIGFVNLIQEVPLNLTLQGKDYFNENGPLDPEWRSGDSIWSLVKDKKLVEVLNQISILKNRGKLQDFILDKDKTRLSCGQVTFTIAHKQKNSIKSKSHNLF